MHSILVSARLWVLSGHSATRFSNQNLTIISLKWTSQKEGSPRRGTNSNLGSAICISRPHRGSIGQCLPALRGSPFSFQSSSKWCLPTAIGSLRRQGLLRRPIRPSNRFQRGEETRIGVFLRDEFGGWGQAVRAFI